MDHKDSLLSSSFTPLKIMSSRPLNLRRILEEKLKKKLLAAKITGGMIVISRGAPTREQGHQKYKLSFNAKPL